MNEIQNINRIYITFKENKISGRYITLKDIEPLFKDYQTFFEITIIGVSYLNKPIYSIKIGNGKKKVLIWTQMHGNESTGTKSVFDLLSFIANFSNHPVVQDIMQEITIIIIPMLNPDGAENYTRVNAQEIDLNRDAVDLKAPESKLLHNILYSFKPDYCFNLHDQRNIFSVGSTKNPATISLLAPSENIEREVTPTRIKTMKVIASIYTSLSEFIPNQLSRYTDEFYPTATGDNFQKAGFPTILIEAGHFINDYQREITRKYNFLSLLVGLLHIANNNKTVNYITYFDIPKSTKEYFDLIYTNIYINNVKNCIGITFKEILKGKKLDFSYNITQIDSFEKYGYNYLINNKLYFDSVNDMQDYFNKEKKNICF